MAVLTGDHPRRDSSPSCERLQLVIGGELLELTAECLIKDEFASERVRGCLLLVLIVMRAGTADVENCCPLRVQEDVINLLQKCGPEVVQIPPSRLQQGRFTRHPGCGVCPRLGRLDPDPTDG